ncbi:hypothetical protein AFE02nite_17660 [Actinotalea fermentans]|uniref:RAMA domain-containing protein n=2 Tax=Actinotalea fermentans TaxID=43671 RepID=A0A511YXW3_9CELL|nr:hypothetical protein AFE02nite_17660 [Actinotalea fermentans]
MVADQLDALLGEHLMPLRARTPGRDEPYLLAVDASGQPVVVEVVAILDEDAVMAALRHAGRAARMTTRDLAEAYSGGADRFASHLAAFRLTVPATALLSTFVRGGARLLLVCSHVSAGAADVLEFLLQPRYQVDVLRAQVVTEPDGQRVVELSPVARPTPPRRDFELPPWAEPERPDPLFDPTPLFRSTSATRPERRLGPSTPLQRWDDPFDDERYSLARRYDDVRGDPWERRHDERRSPARVTASQPVAPQPPVAAAPVAPPPAYERVQAAPAPHVPTPARPAPAVVAPPYAVRMAERAPEPADPVLVALADALEGPAPLVWCPDGDVCFEATLRPDGFVELANGSRFGDVDAATRAISGVDGPLDSWQVWHVDSATGPTLAELAAAVFPEQF